MQSELALFAREFQRALAPLGEALRGAGERLRGAPEAPGGDAELGDGLRALAGELAGMTERVARERAAVFVFGPAKGGKSTLLDALAGARVSEVSILPAYPALLRVRHAPLEGACVQRFDGAAEEFGDPAALRLVLQRAHGELAVAVRAARANGEAFDPARHLPGALRRVERTLPAVALADAALELVECPPIHGPLFPTYAEMLIGEPDQARAAVFVVRAAQLADEAAFDGVEELLATFERLILVLNLDERARELSPAGELAPGLEREDPARLIAAFEELSTCEPLARALRSGRVPVLALDLLEAARARLHGAEETPAARPRTRFADLAREVVGALDAHASFQSLAHSGLRRARELCAEAQELGATPALGELARSCGALERERAGVEGARVALARLAERERGAWAAEELFTTLRGTLRERCAARARELALELEEPCARALEDWFAGGDSLQTLLARGLEPRLVAARAELARSAARVLREELRRADPARLVSETRAALAAGPLELARLLTRAVERVHVQPAPVALRALDVEAIPVRARLAQRLTWRSSAEVRRALLGPPEEPALSLSSAVKARRLGPEARAVLQRSASERARAILDEEARALARALDEALLARFHEELRAEVAGATARLAEPLRALVARLGDEAVLHAALAALAPACARVQASLAELAERWAPEGVLVPAQRRTPAAGAEARAREAAFE